MCGDESFSTKLDKILSEYKGQPGISVSIRTSAELAERKRILAESIAPKPGIYWWVPRLDRDVLEWRVLGFWFESYGEDIVHPVFWDKYIVDELIATLNLPRKVIPELSGLYDSLPRGRIIEKENHEFVILHGGDIPKGGSINQVYEEFYLTPTEVIVSSHEMMDIDNHKKLCSVIGIDETNI